MSVRWGRILRRRRGSPAAATDQESPGTDRESSANTHRCGRKRVHVLSIGTPSHPLNRILLEGREAPGRPRRPHQPPRDRLLHAPVTGPTAHDRRAPAYLGRKQRRREQHDDRLTPLPSGFLARFRDAGDRRRAVCDCRACRLGARRTPRRRQECPGRRGAIDRRNRDLRGGQRLPERTFADGRSEDRMRRHRRSRSPMPCRSLAERRESWKSLVPRAAAPRRRRTRSRVGNPSAVRPIAPTSDAAAAIARCDPRRAARPGCIDRACPRAHRGATGQAARRIRHPVRESRRPLRLLATLAPSASQHIARDQALEPILLPQQVAQDHARESRRRLARVERRIAHVRNQHRSHARADRRTKRLEFVVEQHAARNVDRRDALSRSSRPLDPLPENAWRTRAFPRAGRPRSRARRSLRSRQPFP